MPPDRPRRACSSFAALGSAEPTPATPSPCWRGAGRAFSHDSKLSVRNERYGCDPRVDEVSFGTQVGVDGQATRRISRAVTTNASRALQRFSTDLFTSKHAKKLGRLEADVRRHPGAAASMDLGTRRMARRFSRNGCELGSERRTGAGERTSSLKATTLTCFGQVTLQ